MIHPGFLLILLGTVLVPDDRARRAGIVATCAAGLALAGLRATEAALDPAALSALPPGFLAVDSALVWVGIGLAGGAAVAAGRGGRSTASSGAAIAAAALLVSGALGLGVLGFRLFQVAPARDLALAFLAVLGVGLLLLLAGRVVPPVPEVELPTRPVAGLAGVLTGVLLAAIASHAGAVIVGAIVAGWAGYFLQRAAGTSRVPVAPMLTLLLLPAWSLMATIAGAEGLGVTMLPDLPFSPAAERLLAPAFLLAAWAVAGLWPLHRQEPAALVAPAGALLLARLAIPAIPGGLEHWRALALPLVVIGIWHGALRAGRTGAAVGLAWVGLLSLQQAGRVGAALLLAGALLLRLGNDSAWRAARWAVVPRVVAVLALGSGALLAVEAGLQAEVVYTVLAVAGLVAAAGQAAAGPHAMTAREPSATAPSD